MERLLSEEARTALRQATFLELGSTHAVISTIADGAGIGFVSLRAIEERGGDDVVVVPVKGLDIRRNLTMIYRRDEKELPLLHTFIDFALEWNPNDQS